MIFFLLFLMDPVDQIKADVKFLASDELQGRYYPSEFCDQAADYIAEAMKKAGLKPIGESFFDEHPKDLKNVVGLLSGTSEKVIMLSAHYDHIQPNPDRGDGIFNGANDNASGVAVMLEVARQLAKQSKREHGILFVAFSGEEKGLLGSAAFAKNPPIPLQRIAYQLNLEQVGRHDEMRPGPDMKPKSLGLTGFDFTNAAPTFDRFAEELGLDMYHHPFASKAFFRRSDNGPLADSGVPAQTMSAAYMFPDYHGPDDEWEKLDFEYMQTVVEIIQKAFTTWSSGETTLPTWVDTPETAPFRKARTP